MKLNQTKQCKTCPWKLSETVADIPNYSVETHEALQDTIADKTGNANQIQEKLNVMTCHKSINSKCVGWLHNQLGIGNNIPLRVNMMFYSNAKDIEIDGEQVSSFEETFK
ncbi:MAG: DUF6283 family protein [Tychonema bourrellyi B0820]|nr:DUF6283 family protein [Tychonema bourrellyi B0820]PJE45198.1 MAG: hypothetical protein CUR32_00950 [Flavobacterium sp.] [Flavobacterium sp. FEMGT703F]